MRRPLCARDGSHGVFLALCGFEYHGPKGHLARAADQPDHFRRRSLPRKAGARSRRSAAAAKGERHRGQVGPAAAKLVALERRIGAARKVAATLNDAPLALGPTNKAPGWWSPWRRKPCWKKGRGWRSPFRRTQFIPSAVERNMLRSTA